MLKCTINGKHVEVKEGTTVIQAFKMLGEEIAHYCWHPALSVAGVCRLCMVEIEGNPRLQIACNTAVTEGMVVTNKSEKVKDAVKWGLDFHLINHPLDCPICDQAGECGLQDQYMKFGKYDPEMAEKKVNKHKAVDLGERVVLDSERCILCSRCVRFTEEISKTNELGIFNRGDRSEIGTFEDKPMTDKYSVNTVDICPVGALTSKDFRFKQRVWFLKDRPSVCPGCSTGCNVDVYYNREGFWRVKPRYNPNVNDYWMCDEGRDTYKYQNKFDTVVVGHRGEKEVMKNVNRVINPMHITGGHAEMMDVQFLLQKISEKLGASKPADVALVVTGQSTNEELSAIVSFFASKFDKKNIYHWQNEPEKWNEFDGLLMRGDKNPNTKGLLKVLEQNGVQAQLWKPSLTAGKLTIVVAPENHSAYKDFSAMVKWAGSGQSTIWLGPGLHEDMGMQGEWWVIPGKTTFEKKGSFENFNGHVQSFEPVTTVIDAAVSADEFVTLLKGANFLEIHKIYRNPVERVENQFIFERGEM
ncbi:MAG: (2Fe-2S)-binding protein [Bdellovibrionaceae bacterium]|nr:(2Fe-2S)-binding protein [Pseudobdellovibrionaceae bacterium]